MADDEIFVSDGSKCDSGNILDILGHKNKIAITDPVYPVYVDTNVMAGHTGEADEAGAYAKLVYLPCTAENGFVPEPPKRQVDVIYLCSPNNPTGAVGHARAARGVGGIRPRTQGRSSSSTRPTRPTSPTRRCRIRSTKSPARASARSSSAASRRTAASPACAARSRSCRRRSTRRPRTGEFKPLHPLWLRRMTTKFNGVSYIVQRGAEALYSPEGKAQVRALIEHYLGNAKILREGAKRPA